MTDDEKAIYENIIVQYRQDVDQLKYALARANAQGALKERIINDLRALRENPSPPKPSPPTK